MNDTVLAKKARVNQRLQQLDLEIAEVVRRLPAHSAKPPLMQELLALEDERDLLQQQLWQMAD